jgi:hypothetical protein
MLESHFEQQDINFMEKNLVDMEKQLTNMQKENGINPDQLEFINDALEEIDEEVTLIAEHHADRVTKLQELSKGLHERINAIVKATRKPVFNLTEGTYLNGQYCNNHTIHFECLERYLKSLQERAESGQSFEGEDIVELENGEYLCVVCRRLANALVPIIPFHTALEKESANGDYFTKVGEWTTNSLNILVADKYDKPTFVHSAPLIQALEQYVNRVCELKPEVHAIDLAAEEADLYAAETLCSTIGATLGGAELYLRGKGGLLETVDKTCKVNLRSIFFAAMAYRYTKGNSVPLFLHQKYLYNVSNYEVLY